MDTEERNELVRKAIKSGRELFATLGIVDTDNGPGLPSAIRVRQADGQIKEEPCTIIELDEPRRYKSRVRAREWAAELKLDPVLDKDFASQLENFELLAYALREATAPYTMQLCKDGRELFAKYKQGSLQEIWGIYDQWSQIMNPRYGELDRDELWQVANEIAEKETLLPLMLIGGIAQSSCIVSMAKAAVVSPMAPSLLRSHWTSRLRNGSTPETAASESPSSST